jgi:hypothetical protein
MPSSKIGALENGKQMAGNGHAADDINFVYTALGFEKSNLFITD